MRALDVFSKDNRCFEKIIFEQLLKYDNRISFRLTINKSTRR